MSTVTHAAAPVRILRFDRVQRAAHWANAILFGILVSIGGQVGDLVESMLKREAGVKRRRMSGEAVRAAASSGARRHNNEPRTVRRREAEDDGGRAGAARA